LTKFDNDKNKIHKDGDTLEDFYRRAHLDETRRKFLDGLKEGRENSLVEEKSPVTKKEINWDIEPCSPLSI
jgi:negative regulator of sigma E activity